MKATFATRFKRWHSLLLGSLAAISFAVSCQCEKHTPWTTPQSSQFTPINFGGEGAAQWEDDTLHLDLGVELTGTRYHGPLPEPPYEIQLQARKLTGSDFFCGLTVPVRDTAITLIIGGWGGGVVGISSIDGQDASQNETTSYHNFESNRWYDIRLQVEENHLTSWLNDVKIIDVDTTGKTLGLRPGSIEQCAPLGLAAWQTEAEIRHLRWRSLVR